MNRLEKETSPYLLQHAKNPVDWYPWCEEAFERAKREDKPIFLSIGYSSCHWCHVMAKESFEDERVADMLNRSFISIKADREERPDVDSVYMAVCQAFTGSGGWPMSIFMAWNKEPFLAGTYFPLQPRYGMPGFCDLLEAVADRWDNRREELLHSAQQVIAQLKWQESGYGKGDAEGAGDVCEKAVRMFLERFDYKNGGFGDAPKFPAPHNLWFLLRYAMQNDRPEVLEMAEKTLTQMRRGGIFDQIGYGFSRYSTDSYFLVPHFEKMLCDNALLIIAYAAAYAATLNPFYLDTAEKTAQYALREMTSLDGGFYSAQDADSEGVEGKYYTFTLEEIMDVLGEEKGKRFSKAFDVTKKGNFEGANIPNLLKSKGKAADFADEIGKLYDYRKGRCRLHMDDKALLSWNSMMIAALSALYRVSRKEEYIQAAVRAQRFLEGNLCEGMQLYASWREGKHSGNGFLDDYAFYIAALTELYHSTLDEAYLEKAQRFCREAVRRFADDAGGGYFLSEPGRAELFINPKEFYDGAVPSGNSAMAYNFVRLCQLTGKEEYRELAERQLDVLAARAQGYLPGHSMFLLAKLLYENPPERIKVALDNRYSLEEVRRQLPLLANVTVVSDEKEYPLVNGRVTFYICRGQVCLAPQNTLSSRRENG